MMKSNIVKILLACVICMAAFGTSCILEDKVVQIVFTDKTSAEFNENSQDEHFLTTVVVDYADQIDDILADNDIDRDSIETAIVVSASYGVTSFTQDGDWEITGTILVDRQDISIAQDTLIKYTRQSIRDALGRKIPAQLHPGGVGILNQALAQYVAGTHNPVIEFTVDNGDVEPDPSPTNPIVFGWKTWLVIQVILTETFEVPDPF
ncbi:MAG: hypothetical protein ABIA59_10580 [Candidatus Latescibacterota bacterium]